MLDPAFNVLHHNDCVVHHDADRQHEPKQGKIIETKSQPCHKRKCADDRNGNRHQWNERGPPVL